MTFDQYLKEENFEEMKKLFEDRTKLHIGFVQKYCNILYPLYSDDITNRGDRHDASKFKEPEIEPYVYINWKYKCKDDGVEFNPPRDTEQKMKEATLHHIKTNDHHPEFWTENVDVKPMDVSKMSEMAIAEMVADWCAMSDEKGGNPKDWADKVLNEEKKWKFTPEQLKLIYELIEYCWSKKDTMDELADSMSKFIKSMNEHVNATPNSDKPTGPIPAK